MTNGTKNRGLGLDGNDALGPDTFRIHTSMVSPYKNNTNPPWHYQHVVVLMLWWTSVSTGNI